MFIKSSNEKSERVRAIPVVSLCALAQAQGNSIAANKASHILLYNQVMVGMFSPRKSFFLMGSVFRLPLKVYATRYLKARDITPVKLACFITKHVFKVHEQR